MTLDPVTRYASVAGHAHRLGGEEVVFLHDGEPHVMTTQVLAALDASRPFATMGQHVAAIQARLPALVGQDAAISRVLENLMGRGLLVDEATFVDGLRKDGPAAAVPADFSAVFIRAADRPEALRALLDSLARYEKVFGCGRRYVVVDDSRDAASTQAHEELVDRFGRSAGVQATLVGPSRWQSISAELARETGIGEPASSLLGEDRRSDRPRSGGGDAKNLITLLAAGSRFALLDDDFIFDIRRHPDSRGSLIADDSGLGVRMFADVDAALEAGGELTIDPIERDLDVVGHVVGHIVDHLQPGEIDLTGLAPSRSPFVNADAKVVATTLGHRGDSGASDLGWLYLIDPAGRASFAADRATYLRNLKRPALWYGSRQPSLRSAANFTPFVVDASEVLPCVPTVGRAEDALFGQLVANLNRHSIVLEWPDAMAHRQPGASDRAEWVRSPLRPDLNRFIADFIGRRVAPPYAGDVESRYQLLAARLADFAAADDAELLAAAADWLRELRARFIDQLQRAQADAADTPVHWQADLRSLVEANGRALATERVPGFAGMTDAADAAPLLAELRARLLGLSRGLHAWPALFEYARHRRSAWLGS